MAPVIIFSPLALDDAAQAFAWYEEQQTGLDEKFSKQLQQALNA